LIVAGIVATIALIAALATIVGHPLPTPRGHELVLEPVAYQSPIRSPPPSRRRLRHRLPPRR
jgi:hypothetical protein